MTNSALDWATQYPSPHAGMPPLDQSGRPLAFFEYWPPYVFYTPVAIWCALLALRFGSFSLPTIANPKLFMGGLIGESKSEILNNVGPQVKDVTAPFVTLETSSDSAEDDFRRAIALLQSAGIQLPIVAKPDLGTRSVGVRPIYTESALKQYLAIFPRKCSFLLQKLVPDEGEAGVFYIRMPGDKKGRIYSLTLKYFPYVIGDGVSTLRELILADPRAGRISRVFFEKHFERLDTVLSDGYPFRLTFVGSHARGAIFRDGAEFITDAMTEAFDDLSQEIPEFYFGRYDVRFSNFADLQQGKGFTIIEVNGAGGEATHIWDRKTKLRQAYSTLFEQYRLLYEIGALNRARGYRPVGIRRMFGQIYKEARLTMRYPAPD